MNSKELNSESLKFLFSAMENPEPQPSSSTSEDVVITELGNKTSEEELADKFLSGPLTYDGYTALMGNDGSDDELLPEVDDENTEDTTDKDVTDTPSVKPKKVRKTLPSALKGLMGEANLRWAQGESEIAEKMCLEIIRQIPTAPEPFLTLAQIYETANPEKSFQFSLIAAHLSPGNCEQWERFAEICENERGDLKQAAGCYTMALQSKPKDINLHLKRIELFETVGDVRKGLQSKMRLLRMLPPSENSLIESFAQKTAEEFYKKGEIQNAFEAMNIFFQKCSSFVSNEHINRMLELLLTLKKYEKFLEVLVAHCSVVIEAEKQLYDINEGNVEEKLVVLSFTIPDNLPIDIGVKFIICLIHMKTFHLLDPLLDLLKFTEIEKSGDLYFDIAEAFIEEAQYELALELLGPLLNTNNFNMAAVWLRHAECLQACGRIKEAIDNYKQVVQLAPQLREVRMTLSNLLKSTGNINEALLALEQDYVYDKLDPYLLYVQCKMLKEHKQTDDYLRIGALLFLRHANTKPTNIQFPFELEQNPTLIFEGLIGSTNLSYLEDDVKIDLEEEWTMYKDMIEMCFRNRRYDLAQRFAFAGLFSKQFMKNFKSEIELIALLTCIWSGDYFCGYNIGRSLVISDVLTFTETGKLQPKVWNLLNIIIQKSEDCRHNKFIMRLLTKRALDPAINILHANNCLVAGTYKYALNEYIGAFRLREDPMLAFLIGVTLIQMACQKFSAKKHSLVVQGFAFLTKYKKLRGKAAEFEVKYNFGRIFHQLGILPVAIKYYKEVLEHKTSLSDSFDYLNLKREAAFNLSLCYSSTSRDVALGYLRKYIVV